MNQPPRTRRTRVRHDEFASTRPRSPAKHRGVYMLVSGLIGTALGAAADLALGILRALTQPSSSGDVFWLFVWVLGLCGVGIGATLGVRATDVYLSSGKLADYDQNPAQQFIIRVVSTSISLALTLWFMLNLFSG